MDIFENGSGNLDQLPMDLPAGPEYVLGPGDGLNIDLWGSVSQRLHRVVDRQGQLSLPEIGSIQVSGHELGDVQRMVQSALRSQYRQLEANLSLDKLRTVRVYVVGDVQRPGAYDVSSLSTPLNALYEAGGPTTKGSMRIVRHYRGNLLVENVDLYDLMLHGVQSGMQRLESGDTVLVPPIGQEITIEGMVRRPAIYELAGEKSLGALTSTIDSDSDTEIQKSAVVAIGRRPKDEAIPILIRTARTHPKMQVRKQAIQMLGQTGDERAVAFFKELLGK